MAKMRAQAFFFHTQVGTRAHAHRGTHTPSLSHTLPHTHTHTLYTHARAQHTLVMSAGFTFPEPSRVLREEARSGWCVAPDSRRAVWSVLRLLGGVWEERERDVVWFSIGLRNQTQRGGRGREIFGLQWVLEIISIERGEGEMFGLQ